MLKSKKGLLLVTSAVIFAQSTNAMAADLGTNAGTSVNNTATVSYSVGTTAQTPVSSNTDTFVVDRKVNLTVDETNSAATTVTLGETGLEGSYTTFTLTNLTNDTMDFHLTATQSATGGAAAFTGTDSFDLVSASFKIYRDTDASGTYTSGDEEVTYIDDLAEDDSETLFVVGTVPAANLADGSVATVTLLAQAADKAGTTNAKSPVMTADTTNDKATIQNVFADVAANGDAANNGQASDKDDYILAAPTVAVYKSSYVTAGNIAGSTTLANTPGATVEYCIAVRNTGGAAATTVNIADIIPANTTYVAGSAYTGATVSNYGTASQTCSGGTTTGTSLTGTTPQTEVAPFPSDPYTINGPIASVAAGSTATPTYVGVRFSVTIN